MDVYCNGRKHIGSNSFHTADSDILNIGKGCQLVLIASYKARDEACVVTALQSQNVINNALEEGAIP